MTLKGSNLDHVTDVEDMVANLKTVKRREIFTVLRYLNNGLKAEFVHHIDRCDYVSFFAFFRNKSFQK